MSLVRKRVVNNHFMRPRTNSWVAFWSLQKKKIREALPNSEVVTLLSIFGSILVFFLHLLIASKRPSSLRPFRRRLLQFLEQEQAVSVSDVEITLQSIWGWESRMEPQAVIELINEKITSLKDDPRVSELFFFLSGAYYLQGDYADYDRTCVEGLVSLKSKRSAVLSGLNTKFLFTADWGWNIGHTSMLDQLVKLRELGMLSPERRVVVLSPGDGANKHYLNYWRNHLEFMEISRHEAEELRSAMHPLAEKLTGFELKAGFATVYSAWNIAFHQWAQEKRPPLLDLDPCDEVRGRQVLKKWGVPDGSWFISLHVREYDAHTPNHSSLRAAPNCDIETYMLAIQAIIARGGWVIRMGDSSMSRLPDMTGLIDYANSPDKSDWMDVFLWAASRFFIGTSSGPLTVPHTFGVPVLYTNSCGMGFTPGLGRAIVLPKLFYSKSKRRLLTFDEILGSPLGWTVRIPDDDIEVRDNSPEEIRAAVEEMFNLLDACPAALDSLTELQAEFSWRRDRYGRHASTPIANSFISSHQNLLDEACH